MKISILASALVIFCSAAQAQDRLAFSEVNQGHWAYAAAHKVNHWIFPQEEQEGTVLSNPRRAASRIEFAMVIAQMKDKVSNLDGQTTPYDVNSARDIVAGLQREFENEIKLRRAGESVVENRQSPPLIPPRLTPSPSENSQERIEIELANADVDRSHWSYECAGRVAAALNMPRVPSTNGFRPNLMTRYEFALFVARALDKYPLTDSKHIVGFGNAPDGGAKEKDCLAALVREFQPELQRLGMRDGFSEMPRRLNHSQIPPPRLMITPSIPFPMPNPEVFQILPPTPKP